MPPARESRPSGQRAQDALLDFTSAGAPNYLQRSSPEPYGRSGTSRRRLHHLRGGAVHQVKAGERRALRRPRLAGLMLGVLMLELLAAPGGASANSISGTVTDQASNP